MAAAHPGASAGPGLDGTPKPFVLGALAERAAAGPPEGAPGGVCPLFGQSNGGSAATRGGVAVLGHVVAVLGHEAVPRLER